jgi:alpha-L-arabinofuranosidase
MQLTKIKFDPEYQVGPVDPRIFGGFLEDMGRAVYQGVFDPNSAHVDGDEGISFRPSITGPKYESKLNDEVTFVDFSARLNGSAFHAFVTHRSSNGSDPVAVDLARGQIQALENAEILTGPNPKEANSYEYPERVKSQPFQPAEIKDRKALMDLPPLSFAALTFRLG